MLPRVLALLDSEALHQSRKHRRIEKVDWARLLQRWAQEAPFASRGRVLSFLEPRGLSALLERLPKTHLRYAVTGSLAATKIAPVAPARLAAVYVADGGAAAGAAWPARGRSGSERSACGSGRRWRIRADRTERRDLLRSRAGCRGSPHCAGSRARGGRGADLLDGPERGCLAWMSSTCSRAESSSTRWTPSALTVTR